MLGVSSVDPCTSEAKPQVLVVNIVYPRQFLKPQNLSSLPLSCKHEVVIVLVLNFYKAGV